MIKILEAVEYKFIFVMLLKNFGIKRIFRFIHFPLVQHITYLENAILKGCQMIEM